MKADLSVRLENGLKRGCRCHKDVAQLFPWHAACDSRVSERMRARVGPVAVAVPGQCGLLHLSSGHCESLSRGAFVKIK